MFQRLNDILPESVNVDHEDEVADVCDLWHKYANQVFLSKIMNSHEAISFRNGVLVISVIGSIFLYEIKKHERGIVRKINQELGEDRLIKVKYR